MKYLKIRKDICDRLGLDSDTVKFELADSETLRYLKLQSEILELKLRIKKLESKTIEVIK